MLAKRLTCLIAYPRVGPPRSISNSAHAAVPPTAQGAGFDSAGVESSCSMPRRIISPEKALGARAGLLSAFGGNGWGFRAELCPGDGLCMPPGIGIGGATTVLSPNGAGGAVAAAAFGDCSIGRISELAGGVATILSLPVRKSRSVRGAMLGTIGCVQVLVSTVMEQVRNSHPPVPATGGGSWTVSL